MIFFSYGFYGGRNISSETFLYTFYFPEHNNLNKRFQFSNMAIYKDTSFFCTCCSDLINCSNIAAYVIYNYGKKSRRVSVCEARNCRKRDKY